VGLADVDAGLRDDFEQLLGLDALGGGDFF